MLSVVLKQASQQRRYHLSAATRLSSDKGTILLLATDNIDAILAGFPIPGPLDKRRLMIEYVATRAPGLGKFVRLDVSDDYPVIFGEGNSEFSYLLRHLIDGGLIDTQDRNGVLFYGLSMKGWAEHASFNQAPAPRPSTTHAAPAARVGALFDSEYVRVQSQRMHSNVETDPELAIGTGKEVLETVSKTILTEQGLQYANDEKLPKLFKRAVRELEVVRGTSDPAAAKLVGRLLQQTGSIADTLAQLRNKFGTGHGKDASHKGLEARHARLVATIVSAVVEFIAGAPRKPKSGP